MSGYFEIGIYHGKSLDNIGTLWRSAYQLGAAGIFTIGARFPCHASDTVKSWRHIPWRRYASWGEFACALPYKASIVGVEMGGTLLHDFRHPKRALYVLGAEDHGLPGDIMAHCHAIVSLSAIRTASYNVAVAGSVVMYDRCYNTSKR